MTTEGFQPGWKTRGCFYNGNITNGSAGLIIGFGKFMKKGDVVGVYHQRSTSGDDNSSRSCNIIFYHNGRCLGTGFSLEDNDEKYFPCLHVSGSSTVTYSVPSPPTIYEREQAAHPSGEPYSGDWVIDQAFTGPELGGLPLPEGSKFKVSFSPQGSKQYRLSIKIANSIGTSFVITGKMESFDTIQFLGPSMGTLMMPRPELVEIEKFIQSALDNDGGWKKMIVSEEGQLIMSGPTAEIICSRYVETFEPVRSISR